MGAKAIEPLETPASEDRGALARMVMKLLEHWQLSTEQAALLGLAVGNRAALGRYRRGEAIGTSRDSSSSGSGTCSASTRTCAPVPAEPRPRLPLDDDAQPRFQQPDPGRGGQGPGVCGAADRARLPRPGARPVGRAAGARVLLEPHGRRHAPGRAPQHRLAARIAQPLRRPERRPGRKALAQQVESAVKPLQYHSPTPVIHRPFEEAEWFNAIGWPFQHWQSSRYSDGSFGVWYAATA